MAKRTVQLALAIAALTALTIDVSAAAKKRSVRPARRTPPPAALPCGDLVGFQVLLDRQGFSPGQIDGRPGAHFLHALAVLPNAQNLQSSGQADFQTLK